MTLFDCNAPIRVEEQYSLLLKNEVSKAFQVVGSSFQDISKQEIVCFTRKEQNTLITFAIEYVQGQWLKSLSKSVKEP
jgi:hypothetical protein